MPEEQAGTVHPCERAWDLLAKAVEALEAVQEAESQTLQRQALLLVSRRARQYERAVEGLLEELGE